MRRFAILATLAAALCAGRVLAEEFVVDFKNPMGRFRAEGAVAVGGKFEPDQKTLRAILPPGNLGRPGLDYRGQFQLLGDFEVTIAYELKNLPRPQPPDATAKDYDYSNNVQLSLDEPGRIAIVYRNHRSSGEGYGYFCNLDGEMNFGHKPASGPRGTLGLRRVGRRLTFLLGAGDEPPVPLGSVEWGTDSVAVPTVAVFPLQTKDGIEVDFREFRIKADSIEWSKKIPTPRRRGGWPWVRWLAFPIVLVASTVVWRLGSRPRPADATPAAPAAGADPEA